MVRADKNYLSAQRVAITGGTGFIGSHLLKRILKYHPKQVLLISRGSTTRRIDEHKAHIKIKIYHTIHEYIKVITQFNPDYLFVLGGNADPRLSLDDPETDLEHNLLYNFHLLETLKRRKPKVKIIYISSVAVYGEGKKSPLKESDRTIPKSPYGINKLAMEGYIRFYAESFGIKGFSIRLFSTYGPYLYKQVVYDFIKSLLSDPMQLTIRGDGSEIRDLSYIDDQINGIIILGQKAAYTGEVYNLGSGKGISITELALKIAKILGIKPKLLYDKKMKEKHFGDTWIADVSKVKRFNHMPKTGIDNGLKKTIDWAKTA